MIQTVLNTKQYFQAPENYFWRWAEDMEVIEWVNGSTICYRNDLVAILKEVSSERLPPLAPVLLLLSACQNKHTLQEKFALGKTIQSFEDSTIAAWVSSVFSFLEIVNNLPPELKRGKARAQLIYEIFDIPDLVYSAASVKDSLDELNSGRLDALIMQQGEPVNKERFTAELSYLVNAYKKFPTKADLERVLRTGLTEIPEPPEINLPDLTSINLLEQLNDDPETTAIARLTRQLIPVINIPRHSRVSGDQSFGGISDITNRGNYDKLLLSELAQDELVLTARLVNNEALYFRREEPPDNPKQQRTILVDTTLKMWGIPRVYAMSAALAFAHNSKHHELIEAYALGGEKYTEVNLGSKDGVIEALGVLDHSLHCGKSLQGVIGSLPANEQNEYILITDARMFHVPEFMASLQHIKKELSFIITVNRNGELQFFECIKGNTKVIGTAKLALDEFLFQPVAGKQKQDNPDLPAFFLQDPAPLLFPKNVLRHGSEKIYGVEGHGGLTITATQRVLFFKGKEKAARELLPSIEKGTYIFGWGPPDQWYILVNNYGKKFLKFYSLNSSTYEVKAINLSDEIQYVKKAAFNKEHQLIIKTNFSSFLFDCQKCEVVSSKELDGYDYKLEEAEKTQSKFREQMWYGRYFEHSLAYTTMYKVKRICIGGVESDHEGKLMIGNYTLGMVWNNHNIRISENKSEQGTIRHARRVHDHLTLLPNTNVKFRLFQWENGSKALVDPRGFLHLISSDKNLPEITIVLVTGVHTACWSSDGNWAGSAYFIDESQSNTLTVEEFYKKYIQPFIDRLA